MSGDAALHALRLGANEWWACSEPERPCNGRAVFDGRCKACRLKAAAEVARQGDCPIVNRENGSTATLAALVERKLA